MTLVLEIGFIDDQVETVHAVCAAVGDDVAGHRRVVRRESRQQVGRPSALDTDDRSQRADSLVLLT